MLVCLSSATALAQSEELTVPFCGELAAAECAALDGTAEIMAGLTSGTIENRIEIYLTGGPLRDQDLSLQFSTVRTFVIEPKTLARLLELKAMTPEVFQTAPGAASELLLLPLSIDMDQTTTVAFSPGLLTLLAAGIDANIPATLAFHTRMIDKVLYVRLADYAVFGTQPAWVPEWVGIELTSMRSYTAASEVADPEFSVRDAQAELVVPSMALAASVVYDVPPEQIDAYSDFMHLTSLGTSQLDGQAVNTYRLTWDIPRYLGGPIFAQQVGLPGGQSHPNPTSLILGMLASVLLHGLEAEVTQVVGVENSYLYQVETRVEWEIAVAGGLALAESPTVGFTSMRINRDLNAVQSISVPEGAVVPPLNLLLLIFRLMNP
jgi:hypothetical protein